MLTFYFFVLLYSFKGVLNMKNELLRSFKKPNADENNKNIIEAKEYYKNVLVPQLKELTKVMSIMYSGYLLLLYFAAAAVAKNPGFMFTQSALLENPGLAFTQVEFFAYNAIFGLTLAGVILMTKYVSDKSYTNAVIKDERRRELNRRKIENDLVKDKDHSNRISKTKDTRMKLVNLKNILLNRKKENQEQLTRDIKSTNVLEFKTKKLVK